MYNAIQIISSYTKDDFNDLFLSGGTHDTFQQLCNIFKALKNKWPDTPNMDDPIIHTLSIQKQVSNYTDEPLPEIIMQLDDGWIYKIYLSGNFMRYIDIKKSIVSPQEPDNVNKIYKVNIYVTT